MSDPAYKYFDESDIFLANFMKFFPSLYGTFIPTRFGTAFNNLLTPTYNNSVEFCTSLQNGNIPTTGNLGSGGYGTVGDFLITEDQPNQPVFAIIVSIKPNGGFEPFYVPVIRKTGIRRTEIIISANTNVVLPPGAEGQGETIQIIDINDPITEIVFGSMLGHLYDLGLCPFYAKYFSAYICNEYPNYSVSFVIEKANISMHDFMYVNPYIGAIRANTDILINIIFQYIYAVYIGKMYLGFTHFDAHLGNVMITHTSNRTIQGANNISYVYQGTNLENKRYILINMGGIKYGGEDAWIAIKYNGLMVKIIDHGTCAAYLYAAKYPKYKRNFLIKTKDSFVDDADFATCRDNSQKRNIWEIQFFLSCLHESMFNGNHVGQNPDVARRARYQTNIDVLNNFTEQFYGSAQYRMETYLTNNPLMRNTDSVTGLIRNFPGRSIDIDIPAFADPKELLIGLARYCISLGHISRNKSIIDKQGTVFFLEPDLVGVDFTQENSLVFNDNPNDWVKNFNNMDKFIKNAKKVETGCNGMRISDDIFTKDDAYRAANSLPIDHSDANRARLCTEAEKEVEKWHPMNTMGSKLISPLRSNTSYNQASGRFNRDIALTQQNFPRQLQARDSLGNISIFKMQINPKALRMNRVDPGALVYSTHQNWIDHRPLRQAQDTQIEIVRLNIIVVDPKSTYNVKLNYLDNLWDATRLSTSTCFSINGGYYAVQENLSKLTQHVITQQDVNEQRPIGFCYNQDVVDGTNGTYLPVPKPYRSQFGVVWCSDTNVLHIDTHDEFMSWHETIDQPICYLLDDGRVYATDQTVIKMHTSTGRESVKGISPVMKSGIQQPYKWAFCSGVLLVLDGNVVFDLDMMLNTEFYIVETDQPTKFKPSPPNPPNPPNPKPNNLTKYKLLVQSIDCNQFKCSDHGDMFDSYGVKVSNRYSTHNVMAITNTGKIMFFLVEGRGFNAPGLDRVQIAYLVDKFGIHKAISLDGGFSANAVYKMDNDTPKYVQNDPQKRRLSTSMTFTFNNPKYMPAPHYIGYNKNIMEM